MAIANPHRQVNAGQAARLPAQASPHPGMGFKQFVAMIAAMMAINGLAIDGMLPALEVIGKALVIPTPNARQWIVTAYMMGFGTAQLAYGPLSDRFGRRPVLLTGLSLYVAFSLLAALSRSFEMMLVARMLQGVGAAASRVLAVSIVRDCYAGRKMARVMSLSFIVFLAVPIFAPSFGQIILLFAPWPFIFVGFAVLAAAVTAWIWIKLPETMHVEDRRPISVMSIARGFKIVVTNRLSIGYTAAMTVLMGGLFGFINSAQQVFFDVFPRAEAVQHPVRDDRIVDCIVVPPQCALCRALRHPRPFAYGAGALYRLRDDSCGDRVQRRRVARGLCAVPGLSVLLFRPGRLQFRRDGDGPARPYGGNGGVGPGLYHHDRRALCGFWIGQHFDGTVIPLTLGFAGFGIGGFLVVLIVEKGRLFRPTPSGEASAVEFSH